MSLFRKFFGSINPASEEEKESEFSNSSTEKTIPIDELFTFNFKKNGGKFLYCENRDEVKEQFENILEENDWFESEVMCYDTELFGLLDDNKLTYNKPNNPKFLLASCENLIADEGSILFSSKQIKQHKPNELPASIIVFAKTSQIISAKSDGLSAIKKKYERDYPVLLKTFIYCF